MTKADIPKDGIAGLVQNFGADVLSGFLVFLLALPLSLGIAAASGFPAAMGVLTAVIGGLVVSFFAGSRLTIKGPAAGLITVCAGAVAELTDLGIGDVSGLQLTCGAIAVMAAIQFLFGVARFGSVSDFFPRAAVHGMLAAIGILIFAKQFPILIGVPSSEMKGLSPISLYAHIPQFVAHATPEIALIGIASLIIVFGMPALGGVFRKIPAPMIVLAVMIPLGMYLNLTSVQSGSLVRIGNFWGSWKDGGTMILKNVSFAAIGTFVFWKYVVMFLFVNSVESLLTVKAVDGMDPWKRKSDYNKDLRGLAIGNGLSGLLGGPPMISEVARSSANVGNGARTRWANFFHGMFLLLSMVLFIPVIELIPNAALAAMLIFVAYRLASPKEFVGTFRVGPEQLVIFLVTIFVTVARDLLMGVAAGVLVKFIFHIINGASPAALFKVSYSESHTGNENIIRIAGVAVFSNLLGYKKLFDRLKPGEKIVFDFSAATLIDHTFMEAFHDFEQEYARSGGSVTASGLNKFKNFSDHPLAARKQIPTLPTS